MKRAGWAPVALALSCGGGGTATPPPPSRDVAVSIDTSRVVANVDDRFLSFALDAAQVVGSKWWGPSGDPEGGGGQTPIAPYDFSRARLRALTKELSPAYLRVGGTEADRVHYDMSNSGAPTPAPFTSTLTGARWDAMADFAKALDLRIMFTLAAGPGDRDATTKAWKPDQAQTLMQHAKDRADPVALWELGNEINGYSLFFGPDNAVKPAAFVADVAAARTLIDDVTPGVKLGAPSSAYWPRTGELVPYMGAFLDAGGGAHLDVITWHYYPMQSTRCALAVLGADPALMHDPATLDEINVHAGDVEAGRSRNHLTSEIWLGESGGAQCGGQPGLSNTFLDGIWWLDELGMMAKRGHRVVVRQTLSGSDYGLIDDATLTPRPDYWVSVLFKRNMGEKVLAATSSDPNLRVYAHCARASTSDVVLGVVNLDAKNAANLALPGDTALVWALTSPADEASTDVVLNASASPLTPNADGSAPTLDPVTVSRGSSPKLTVTFPKTSYGFIRLPGAAGVACK